MFGCVASVYVDCIDCFFRVQGQLRISHRNYSATSCDVCTRLPGVGPPVPLGGTAELLDGTSGPVDGPSGLLGGPLCDV